MASSSSSPPPWELGLKTDAAEQERLNALQLRFNTDGRIPSCGEDGRWKGINFATRNTPTLLSPQTTAKALQATLALMDEGADDDDDDAPDVDPSFFLPAEAEPCSMHEVLARAIFRAHTQGVDYDAKNSGAEWWFVVREPRSPTLEKFESSSGGDGEKESIIVDHDGGKNGIAFHFDKDVMLASLGFPYVHPQLSTVTYLTGSGAPTVVCPMTRSVNGKLDQACTTMFVSYPTPGKHLIFDGRKLHGVPESLCYPRKVPNDTGKDVAALCEPRVTFLVNIWLNHSPFGVQRFPFSDFPSARLTMPSQGEVTDIEESVIETIRRMNSDTINNAHVVDVISGYNGINSPTSGANQWEVRVTVDGQERSEADELMLHVPEVPVMDQQIGSTFNLRFGSSHGPRFVSAAASVAATVSTITREVPLVHLPDRSSAEPVEKKQRVAKTCQQSH